MISRADVAAIVGDRNILTSAEAAQRSVRWGFDEPCECGMLVMPADTAQVAAVVRLCAAAGQTIVPHGGRTGLAGGAVSTKDDLVLSLEKLNRIQACDHRSRTMLVEAGVTIQQIQQAAREQGCLFALDFGARGSATLGGAIATNAGGHRVFRYGMMREQILGLEVVLADGTVVDGLKGIIKDNAGYDLKHLFIGSEGTLGIVTRAVLRLRPATVSQSTALVAFGAFDQAIAFLRWMETRMGGKLSAFELLWQSFYDAATRHRGAVPGLTKDAPFYALIEAEGADMDSDEAAFLSAMEDALEGGMVEDAVLAKSGSERDALWNIREDVDVLMRMGDRVDFDVSLPIEGMMPYLDQAQGTIVEEIGKCAMIVFGHIADNNIHAMALRARPFTDDERRRIKEAMYLPLGPARGSISAEHGVGLDKKAALSCTRTVAELALMQRIKVCLDPQELLNPGKVLGKFQTVG